MSASPTALPLAPKSSTAMWRAFSIPKTAYDDQHGAHLSAQARCALFGRIRLRHRRALFVGVELPTTRFSADGAPHSAAHRRRLTRLMFRTASSQNNVPPPVALRAPFYATSPPWAARAAASLRASTGSPPASPPSRGAPRIGWGSLRGIICAMSSPARYARTFGKGH